MRKNKEKTVQGVTNPKSPEVKYRKQLLELTRKLKQEVDDQVIPILKTLEPEYVNDAYARTLQEVFDRLRDRFKDIGTNARIVANDFVQNTNNTNKQRFYKAMENAVGVDLQSIIQNEGLEETLVATTRQNVSLIKSIPDEYFKNIETIVFTNTTQGSKSSSIIRQIQKLNNSTEKRARLIARDQTSKLNSALSQQRQQNLGVEEYIWRTAGDERVRDNHRSKNGKIFKWSDPPKDTGHPGEDIQCRCVAQPIIKT